MDQSPRRPPGYELGFQIGSGGMATVHYGRRVGAGGFSHAVAIKQLHPHLASTPEVVSMFLDEARLAARVVHTNVVSILDVVEDSGEVWAIMPYVEGESLSRLAMHTFKEGRAFPVGVTIAIVLDLLAGLEAAHTATDPLGEPLGIVHRDVSPQNVLVGTDGVARVLDFGVAKARGRLHETRDGQVKGKLAYMAPEQLGGEASVSTDVYAAAIVLWELLAGRRMFQGQTEMALLGQVLLGATTPPSAHAKVPAALDELVMRALSLDPKQRFESAAAMSRALLEAAGGFVASRAEVAAVVSEGAAEAIAERRRLSVDMVRRPESSRPRVILTPTPQPFASVTERMTPSTAGTTTPTISRARRRRRAFVVMAIMTTFVAIVLAAKVGILPAVSARTAILTPEPTAPVAAPALSATTPPAESIAPSAPLQTPASAVATSPSHATAKLVAAKAPVASGVRPAAPKSAVAPVAAPAPAPVEDCDPPFVVDASGVRHYKRSCIR